MDLSYHGAVHLAERLLAEYARESNDFDMYALVDFYESYRAYVRGKIAHLLAADEGASPEARASAAREARRYFLLALSFDRKSLLSPALVAVGGAIASGKSTVAARIGAELSAPVIDADRTRKHLLGARPTEKVHEAPWVGAYDPSVTDRVYAEVLRRAEIVLASGRPVVVDASFRSARLRGEVQALARARGVPFRFVECKVAIDLARARLEARAQGESVSDGRLEILEDFRARFEPVTELAGAEHVTIDTSRPIEESLAIVREHIATWPLGL
jgi:predicted kinase